MSMVIPDYRGVDERTEREKMERLRDEFAMAALSAIGRQCLTDAGLAMVAYKVADAMLEARKEKK